MTGSISAYTNLQKNPQAAINSSNNAIGSGGNAWTVYTCPTGKKAIVNVLLTKMVSFGTGTKLDLFVASQLTREATVGETRFTNENLNQMVLTAGQTILISSDAAGNNASAAVLMSITELPA